jgi:histidinol-phosphatase (PHP family)
MTGFLRLLIIFLIFTQAAVTEKDMVDYHNHTSLCGHASGEIYEYIESALKKGILDIGFSDHAAMPEDLRQGISMAPEETEFYMSSIIEAADLYSGKINVRLGFEVDFPLFDTFDRRLFSDERIDYIMGSCHFLDTWAFDHPEYVKGFDERDIDSIYLDYYSIIEAMADTGLFDVIGHFDLVKKFGHRPRSSMESVVRRIASRLAATDTAVEINTAGLRKPVKEIYPSADIVEIFFQENVPLTMGSDSHSPEEVGAGYAEAFELLKKAGYRKVSGFEKRKRFDINIF